jgi:hypothetical protein
MAGKRTRMLAGGAALAAATMALGSCNKGSGGLPPLPEFTAAQKSVWTRAPGDALGGLVIGDFSHLLGRLRALRTLAMTGPTTKKFLDQGQGIAKQVLGFDPLDDDGWRKAGLEPNGPLGFLLGPDKSGEILFKASNPATAQTTAMSWMGQGGSKDPFDCAPAGELYRCGTPTWKLADDAGKSLWPHMEKNLPAAQRGMEMVGYAPLDQGETKAAIDKDNGPFKELHAGWMTMTIAKERLVWRGGAAAGDFARYTKYFTPRPGTSIIGLAANSFGAGRMTFSPDELWNLLKSETKNAGVDLGAVSAVAGFDLEKDVIQNLTGEIVYAGYRSDKKTNPQGKKRAYIERLGYAMVSGTRDDAAARKVADRLGEMLGGAVGAFGSGTDGLGIKVSYRVDAGDRKVHWVSVDLDSDKAKMMGMSRIEAFLTTIPGGIVIGLNPVGLEELKKRVGNKPAAMLDKLPLAEEREILQKSPFAFWGAIGEDFAFKEVALGADLGLFGADIAAVMKETMAIFQLVYDGVAGVELSADRAELVYQLNFL